MTVADRYEGQDAGSCGCGSGLAWTRDAEGEWHVTHLDIEAALVCSAMSMADEPSDVDEMVDAG